MTIGHGGGKPAAHPDTDEQHAWVLGFCGLDMRDPKYAASQTDAAVLKASLTALVKQVAAATADDPARRASLLKLARAARDSLKSRDAEAAAAHVRALRDALQSGSSTLGDEPVAPPDATDSGSPIVPAAFHPGTPPDAKPESVQPAQLAMPIAPGLPPMLPGTMPDAVPPAAEGAIGKSLDKAGRRAAEVGKEVAHGNLADAAGHALLGKPFPPEVDDPEVSEATPQTSAGSVPTSTQTDPSKPLLPPLPGRTALSDDEKGKLEQTNADKDVRTSQAQSALSGTPKPTDSGVTDSALLPHIVQSQSPAILKPDRRKHILEGDTTGGGHRPGTGRSGKSEFPANWPDSKIVDEAESVANDPNSTRVVQKNGRLKVDGTRDGVDICVIINADGTIRTAFPTNQPRNP